MSKMSAMKNIKLQKNSKHFIYYYIIQYLLIIIKKL